MINNEEKLKELIRLNELEHEKSEIINKNVKTIFDLYNAMHQLDKETIAFQQKMIFFLIFLHIIHYIIKIF